MINGSVHYRPLFRHVLQTAHVEPAIWHATIALGSLHQSRAGPTLEDSRVFGLQHYCKAVQALNKMLVSNNRVASCILLSASLLFATFEVEQREYGKASLHIDGSLNYLCGIANGNETGTGRPDEAFSDIFDAFLRLDVSSFIFSGIRTRLNYDAINSLTTHLYPGVGFESTFAASQTLLFCLAAMRHLEVIYGTDSFADLQDSVKSEARGLLKERLLFALNNWEQAMSELDPQLAEEEEQRRAKILRSYNRYCRIRASVLGGDQDTELRYDDFLSEFEEILSIASSLMHAEVTGNFEEDCLRYPSCSTHAGIIHLLWFVAIKCRDPGIRHEAIRLLKKCNHQESLWDGRKIASYAETAITIEESGAVHCAADVPFERRLSDAWFDARFDDNVLHCKRGTCRHGVEWVVCSQTVVRCEEE